MSLIYHSGLTNNIYWNAVKWRTGFLRIYIVALVLWEAFMVALFVSDPASSDSTAIIAGVIIPPIVVYVLVFVAIPWIGKGFK
jgi:hypothetical protein